MIEGIKLENGEYGQRAVLTSAWSEEMTSYLVDKEVVELELNDGKGWHGKNLLFLTELPQLRSLKIIDLKIASVEPIHFLHELKSLEVITYCKTEIRFFAFPQLEKCCLEWRPKATSVFDCQTLRSLFVNHYNGKDVDSFNKLINLESLAILTAPVENLLGLKTLKKLKYLRLANLKKLVSLAGLENLTDIEELDINTCRAIGSIKEVANLKHLHKLYLNNNGDIESLHPISELNELESVIFYESTNIIDGDLSPLLVQKNLTRVSFKNRLHYSHKREEFGVTLTM